MPEIDPSHLEWWHALTMEERWAESCRLCDIYSSLSETEQRMLMRGDDTLAPGEFRWRLQHYLGKTDV